MTESLLSRPLPPSGLGTYRAGLRVSERGRILSIGDGVVWIAGLPSAAMDALVMLSDGSEAVIFHLAPDAVGAILLGPATRTMAGDVVRLAGTTLSLPVGESLLGRVITPLGLPLDDLAPPADTRRLPIDGPSPAILEREVVDTPLYTGTKVVDTLIPIGRGQRQLLIGDNGTGKSTLALDAVLSQQGQDVRCIYVLIGQKRSAVVQTLETLRRSGALAFTSVVVAEATAGAGLKYLAPFAGCALAESWMREGHDTLIVYDDLTTHARAYRELSLLLRHPPGREAYPADIFYLHARLLERSTRLNAARGGGSMTALPIAETEQGEIASYIPTNLISITDGQIYFDTALFARGTLPAIDITRSVSRIGGNAQEPAIAREAGRMKLDYLQFLELEVFTRFGARLEASVEARIRRGRQLRTLLAQEPQASVGPKGHLAWLMAYNEGVLDGEAPPSLVSLQQALVAAAEASLLPLDAPRDQWLQALQSWLPLRQVPHEPAP